MLYLSYLLSLIMIIGKFVTLMTSYRQPWQMKSITLLEEKENKYLCIKPTLRTGKMLFIWELKFVSELTPGLPRIFIVNWDKERRDLNEILHRHTNSSGLHSTIPWRMLKYTNSFL